MTKRLLSSQGLPYQSPFSFWLEDMRKKPTTTSFINLQKKRRTGKKKRGGHNILDSYIIPMKISNSSVTVEGGWKLLMFCSTVAKGSEIGRTEF